MPPTPEWMMRAPTSSVPSLSSAPAIASIEPCTSPLMTSGNSLRPAVLTCAIICSSEPRMPVWRAAGLVALLARAIVGHLAGARLAVDHREAVAGVGRAVEAEHFDRHRGPGLADRARRCRRRARARGPIRRRPPRCRRHAACRAAPARSRPGRGRGRASPRSRCLRPARSGLALRSRISACSAMVSSSLSRFSLLGRRDLDVEHVAAERLDLHLVLQQLGAHALGLGVGLSILLIATIIGTLAALA